MPGNGNPTTALELFDTDEPTAVATLRASLRACFKWARQDPGLADRTNANRLAAHLRKHAEHYGGATVSKSHIYRIEAGEGPVATDVVQVIAKAYGLQAWHMLVPGLEPSNPPGVLVTEGQRRLFRSLQESYREIPRSQETAHVEKDPAGDSHKDSDRPRATARRGDARGTSRSARGKTKKKAKA